MLAGLLLRAACVLAALPAAQARLYPGRKKPGSFAVERYRKDPLPPLPGEPV